MRFFILSEEEVEKFTSEKIRFVVSDYETLGIILEQLEYNGFDTNAFPSIISEFMMKNSVTFDCCDRVGKPLDIRVVSRGNSTNKLVIDADRGFFVERMSFVLDKKFYEIIGEIERNLENLEVRDKLHEKLVSVNNKREKIKSGS